MASLFHRKTGKQTYTVYVKYRTPELPAGKYRRKSTGIKIRKLRIRNKRVLYPQAALAIRDEIERKLALGKWGVIEQQPPELFSTASQRFIDTQGKLRAKATQRLYKLACDKFLAFIGDINIQVINEDTMIDFRTRSIDRDGEQNTAIWLRSLSPIFTWASERGMIARNPITKRVKLNPKLRHKRAFTPDELSTLFKYLREHEPNLYYLCSYLLRTGVRVQDALSVRWTDVDFHTGKIHYQNHKRGEYEFLVMTPSMREFMRSIPEGGSSFIFHWRRSDSAANAYKTVREQLELHPDLTLHALKRTFATMLTEAGVPPSATQKLAHHADYKTTLTYYTRHQQTYLSEQASKIDSLIDEVTIKGVSNTVSNSEAK